MASRHPSGHGPPAARSIASTSSSTNRRNLLSASHAQHGQRSRGDGSPLSSADLAAQAQIPQDQWQQRQDRKQDAAKNEAANDIIIRDEHGHFEVEMPLPLASLNESGEGLDEDEDPQKSDTRLIDLWRSHNRQHIDVGELQSAVQESLQKKMASLDDDKWMYEQDEEVELLQPS